MFYVLSKILDLAVAPLTWSLALVTLAIFVRTARRRVALLLVALALLTVFASPPVANRLALAAERPAEDTYDAKVTYDAVVLLGGFVEASDAQTASLPARSYNDAVERLLTVYDLLRSGHTHVAILSGGMTEDGVIEAQVMADQLADWGIDRSRLVVEGASRNTRENAEDSAVLLRQRGDQRVLLVTSALHLPRAHGCFRAVGVAVDVLPVDFRSYDPAQRIQKHGLERPWFPRALALEESTAVVRERFGRLVYRLRGFSAG